MKKLLLAVLTILIVVGNVTLPVFADDNEVVESPNKEKEHKEEKIVDDGKKEDKPTDKEEQKEETTDQITIERKDGCYDIVVITSYEDRENIKDEYAYNQICEAYEEINDSILLSDLVPEIEDVAHENKANVQDLAVRYLFDLSIYNNFDEKVHDENTHNKEVELHVEFQTLEDFVCVMMFKDGVWSIVEGARLDPNDPTRLFIPIITGSATYAIVVASDYNYQDEPVIDEPITKEIYHWVILLLGLILGVIFIITTNKEDEKNDDIKPIKMIRILLLLIDILISLIIYIFYKECDLEIIALLINYSFVTLVYLYTRKDENEEKNN